MEDVTGSREESIQRFRRAVSGAMARIGDSATGDEVLRYAAEQAEVFERVMASPDPASIAWGFTTAAADPDVRGVFVIGLSSPELAVRTAQIDDGVEGEVIFTSAFRGPPGGVHGGHIARLFDDVCAIARSVGANEHGVTRSLAVTYRKMTPLDEALTFRARVVRVEGREATVISTLHHGETLLAEAEAVFVRVSRPPTE